MNNILVKTTSANLRDTLDYVENAGAKTEFYEKWAQGYRDITVFNN